MVLKMSTTLTSCFRVDFGSYFNENINTYIFCTWVQIKTNFDALKKPFKLLTRKTHLELNQSINNGRHSTCKVTICLKVVPYCWLLSRARHHSANFIIDY